LPYPRANGAQPGDGKPSPYTAWRYRRIRVGGQWRILQCPLAYAVIPAKAGIQSLDNAFPEVCGVDSRLRGNDGVGSTLSMQMTPLPLGANWLFDSVQSLGDFSPALGSISKHARQNQILCSRLSVTVPPGRSARKAYFLCARCANSAPFSVKFVQICAQNAHNLDQ